MDSAALPAPHHAGKVDRDDRWLVSNRQRGRVLRELLATDNRPRSRPCSVHEFARRRRCTWLRRKIAIDYRCSSLASPRDVLKKLPQLAGFQAYPTTLVIDRSGKVRRVHTGFSGPATGQHYEVQSREMKALVDQLLAESA
jgi:hypothetical protein